MFRRGKGPAESAAEADRQALYEKLAQRPDTVCPFLGLAAARAEYDEQATDEHRCFAFGDPEPVSGEQQRNVCLQRGYANCPRYLRGVLVIPSDELEALRHPPQKVPPPPPPPPVVPPPSAGGGNRRPLIIVLLLLLLIGGGAGVWWLAVGQGPVAVNPTPSPGSSHSPAASASSGPAQSPGSSPGASPLGEIAGTNGFHISGSAAQDGDVLRMTPSDFEQAGAAWYPNLVNVAGGFSARFSIQFLEPQVDGGDGLAFVVQNVGPDAAGGSGGLLGYAGIPNSLAVEFDTHLNHWPGVDDPNDNHVAIQSRGTDPNTADHSAALGMTAAVPNLSDGQAHTVEILYAVGSLSVSVDGGSVLQVALDISQSMSLGPGGTAYVGFTGSTGTSAQVQNLGSVQITFP